VTKTAKVFVRERIMIKARVMLEEKMDSEVRDEMGSRSRPRQDETTTRLQKEATQIRKDREVATSQHFHHTKISEIDADPLKSAVEPLKLPSDPHWGFGSGVSLHFVRLHSPN